MNKNKVTSISCRERSDGTSQIVSARIFEASLNESPNNDDLGDFRIRKFSTVSREHLDSPCWIVYMSCLFIYTNVIGAVEFFHKFDWSSLAETDNSTTTITVVDTFKTMTLFAAAGTSMAFDSVGVHNASLFGSICSIIALITSIFVKDLTALYLILGFYFGACCSCLILSPFIVLANYNPHRVGFVSAVLTGGSTVSSYAYKRACNAILSKLEWRYSVMFACLWMILSAMAIACIYPHIKNFRDSSGHKHNSKSPFYRHFVQKLFLNHLNLRLWRKKLYIRWIMIVPMLTFAFYASLFLFNLSNEERGWTDQDRHIMAIATISSKFGSYLIFGVMSDTTNFNRIRMYQVATLVMTVATVCVNSASTFGTLITIQIVMTSVEAVYIVLQLPVSYQLGGISNLSQALGFHLFMTSVPMLLAKVFTELLDHQDHVYNRAFYIITVPLILAVFLMEFVLGHPFSLTKIKNNDRRQTMIHSHLQKTPSDCRHLSWRARSLTTVESIEMASQSSTDSVAEAIAEDTTQDTVELYTLPARRESSPIDARGVLSERVMQLRRSSALRRDQSSTPDYMM